MSRAEKVDLKQELLQQAADLRNCEAETEYVHSRYG